MEINSISFVLSEANCCFNLDTKEAQLTINLEDRVVVNEINDNKITMSVSRKLFSSNIKKLLVTVEFVVNLDLSSDISYDELKERIRSGMPLLSNVFSRISAVISGITNYSLLGPVVTIPNYDKNKIIIECNN